jgi:hypothetical protein
MKYFAYFNLNELSEIVNIYLDNMLSYSIYIPSNKPCGWLKYICRGVELIGC